MVRGLTVTPRAALIPRTAVGTARTDATSQTQVESLLDETDLISSECELEVFFAAKKQEKLG